MKAMEEEVEWMEDRDKNSSVRTKYRRLAEKQDASLSICRPRHPLFIAHFLMLQSGISHCISPEIERKGKKDGRRRVIRGYGEGKVGQNKGDAGMMGYTRLFHGSPYQK